MALLLLGIQGLFIDGKDSVGNYCHSLSTVKLLWTRMQGRFLKGDLFRLAIVT